MKTDGRVRYTKMVIKQSLIKLLAEKPIQKITVKEICDLAEINRATFYAHYRDAYDLLEQIENELFEDLTTAHTKRDDQETLAKEILLVIRHNEDLCKVLFSENGDRMFLTRIVELSREKTIAEWHQRNPKFTTQRLDYLYTFMTSGFAAVVEQWVRGGMQETQPALGDISQTLIELFGQAK